MEVAGRLRLVMRTVYFATLGGGGVPPWQQAGEWCSHVGQLWEAQRQIAGAAHLG